MIKNSPHVIDVRQIISHIHADLQAAVDPIYKVGATRFFKEQVKLYGVRVPRVRKIAANYAADLKQVPLQELFPLCEQLLKTGYMEDATIALALVYKRRTNLVVDDSKVVGRWLSAYVSNWATCDDLSVHIFGYCIERFPEMLSMVRTWVTSDNRWVRRAAAVSLILPARKGNNFDDVLYIADKLLHDQDDLVQKGCGWMLKEAAKRHQQEVIAYIEKHRKTMPRTMLRYAIELMPREVKQQLMRK
jgi:3-methyladenine DNA glycosylase AlkD